MGAGPSATFTLARDHWATEQHIRGTGIAFTFLRDNLYADFVPALVGDDGVMRGPAGNGRVSVVTLHDIADVATAVLRARAEHAGVTYDLTGPEALTLHDAARIFSDVTGRHATYQPEDAGGGLRATPPLRARPSGSSTRGLHLHRHRHR